MATHHAFVLNSLILAVFAARGLAVQPALPDQRTDALPAVPNTEPLLLAVERSMAEEQWLDAAQAFHAAWITLIRGEDEIRNSPDGSPPVLPSQGTEAGKSPEGFRARLRSLYRTAPDAFRIEYQRQFDGVARAELSTAIRDGKFAAIPALLRDYEHCNSTESAQRLLAAWNIQRGHFFDAAIILRRLSRRTSDVDATTGLLLAQTWARAGLNTEARQAIERLADRVGYGASIDQNGQVIRLPDDRDGVPAWIAVRWPVSKVAALVRTMSGGNVRRVQPQPIVQPSLEHQWTKSLLESALRPQSGELLQAIQNRIAAGMDPVSVGPAESVVVGDRVILSTAGTLQAVHRDTGSLLWESSLFNRQLDAALTPDEETAAFQPKQIAWILMSAGRNHLRGQLATDGNTVFAVEETSQGISSMMASTTAPSLENQQYNMLRAYDVASGRLIAQAGGSAVQLDAEQPDPLMGVFFLGVPLLLDEQIFVLAEDTQGIHLLELRLDQTAENAAMATEQTLAERRFEIVQRQMLSTPQFDRSTHPVRRYAGLTPSFAGGKIICQGCDGQVTAVDAFDLSIVWIHSYRSNVGMVDLGGPRPALAGAITEDDSTRTDLLRRPHDSLARIIGDTLLLMPRDSDQVICVDVQTGRGRWEYPRGRIRFFGAITDDIVIVAGGTEIRALRLSDGSTVWSQELDEEFVSGQPAWTERITQMPTSGGSILTLENATGRRLLRDHVSPFPVGNLLSLPDGVLIQSQEELAGWTAAEAQPPESLAAIRAELLSPDGDTALRKLEDLVERSGDRSELRQAARELLADQLLESLRLDYHGSRHVIPRLRELTSDASPSASQMRDVIRATLGMTPVDALRLPELIDVMQTSHGQRSRLERLIVQGLPQQTDLPADELAEQIAPVISNVLRHAPRQLENGRVTVLSSDLAAGAIARTLRALDDVRRQQVAERLHDVIMEGWNASDSELGPLDKLWFYWMAGLQEALVDLPALDHRADDSAVTSLTRMQFLVSGRPEESPSAATWNQLRELWPVVIDSPAIQESTAWPTSEQWQTHIQDRQNDALGHLATWLVSRERERDTSLALADEPAVNVGPARDGRAERDPMIGAASTMIPVRGAPGAFRGWQLMTLHADPRIIAVDDRGRQRWEFRPNPADLPLIRPAPTGGGGNDEDYAVACGYLLAVRQNQSLFVFDCSRIEDGQPRLLWSLRPGELLEPPSRVQQFLRGWERTTMYQRLPDGLAPMGPLTAWGLPLYQGRRLTVVDPWTGIPRWTADDLPDDCRLAADGDTLCMISASEGLIQVRDMRDGTLRQSGALPTWWTDASELYDSSVRHIELEPGTRFPWRVVVDGTRCVVFRLGHDACELAAHELARPDDGTPVVWSVELPANSVFSSVADGIVAVLSNDTELRLIRLTDGHVLAKHTIDAAVDCDWLYLRSSHERLIVLTHCNDFTQDDAPVIGQTVPVNGPVCAIDTSDWSIVWTDATEHEFIRILEPEKSPIPDAAPLLVLLKATLHRPQNAAIVRELSVRVLDVRSGKVLHTEDNPGRTLNYHGIRFEGDREFTLLFDSRSVEFDF